MMTSYVFTDYTAKDIIVSDCQTASGNMSYTAKDISDCQYAMAARPRIFQTASATDISVTGPVCHIQPRIFQTALPTDMSYIANIS